jgi:murein DD-endopeptidase MepM/ murein hydrolase activator NlpD
MISHGFDEKGRNIVTLYAHLSKISVKNGQKVQTGTKIGNVGSTGRSTGNHLHLTVMLDGTPDDPGTYIRILPERLK